MGKDLNGKNLGKFLTQRKDGCYQARFTDRFGKRVTLYNRDLRVLKKSLKDRQYQDIIHQNVKKEITLDEWFDKWIDIYKHEVRDSTRLNYTTNYRKHISPALGQKIISQITITDVKKILNTLKDDGYGYEVRNKTRIILLDMFNRAIDDDLALKNPVRNLKIEKPEKDDVRALTIEDQIDFFDAAKGTFYDELFNVAVLTGLRPGELFALRPFDIDFKNRKINVKRTLLYQKLEGDSKKEFHIHDPKTKKSSREVKFDERCEKYLRKQMRKKSIVSHKSAARHIEGLDDLLFVTTLNSPLNAVVYSDAIKRIVKLVNESRSNIDVMEAFSGHCFRHTYATRCFEAGVAPKVVQKQLGHASLKMTMDLYTHLFDDKRDEEIGKFSSYFAQVEERENSSISNVVPVTFVV